MNGKESGIMDLESLQQLEERITELTDRFLSLKQDHQEVLDELSTKDKKIEELDAQVKEFQQTKVQIHTRIEDILKRLEFLKSQPD